MLHKALLLAKATVRPFNITVKKWDGDGVVDVKSSAVPGELVTILITPSTDRTIVTEVSDALGITLISGEGNRYSFIMPERDMEIYVYFFVYDVVLTIGTSNNYYGYCHGKFGSLDRRPYWENGNGRGLLDLLCEYKDGDFSTSNAKFSPNASVIDGSFKVSTHPGGYEILRNKQGVYSSYGHHMNFIDRQGGVSYVRFKTKPTGYV